MASIETELRETMEGLRDVLRSAGQDHLAALLPWLNNSKETATLAEAGDIAEAVSYTHLTLPTKRSV